MRRRQAAGWTTMAIGAVVATVLVTSGEPTKVTGQPVQQPVRAVVQALPEIQRTYVALGSSYASGPGGEQVPGNSCHRSLDSYPHQVAAALDMRLVDATCSGSTTMNILRVPQTPMADRPQIDSVTADAALVTITTGGNDINYFGRMMAMSCGNLGCASGTVPPEPTAASYQAVENALAETIAAVRARAPHATVVVVSYPPAVEPTSPDCPALALTADQAAEVSRVHDQLAAATARAAATADAILVDTSRPGSAHTVCSAEPWLDGFTAPVPYHPNGRGKTAMARLVLSALQA